MPEASDGAEGTSSTLVPNQLASLVPTFDPSKDDLTDYTKKVQLLMNMWPEGKWTELATRLILGCTGSAFQKLQLKSAEITVNEKKSIQQIIELLGGHGAKYLWRKSMNQQNERCFDASSDKMRQMIAFWHELTCCGKSF